MIFNPDFIFEKLDDNYYFGFNPQLENSLTLYTETQFNLINKIVKNEEILISENGNNFIQKLKQSKIINETGFLENNETTYLIKTLNMWLHTTDNCNCNCNYCYIRNKGSNFISNELYLILTEKIIKTIKKYNLNSVRIRIAGGEPTLVNNWKSFIEKLSIELQKLKCELYPVILTNGTFIDNDLIDFLKRTKVRISISVDGLNNYQNINRPLINGENSFSFVEKSINLLTQNKLPFNVSIVITNESIDGLIEFTKYLLNYNCSIKYSLVEQKNLNHEKVINILTKCYKLIETAIDKGYRMFYLHRFCDLHFDDFQKQTCNSGAEGITFSSNGDLYFCQKHIGVENPIGNINDDVDLISIAQRGSNYYTDNKYSKECNLCSYKKICTAGCPLERVAGKDIYCEIYKTIIPIIFRLKAKDKLHKLLKVSDVIKSKLM